MITIKALPNRILKDKSRYNLSHDPYIYNYLVEGNTDNIEDSFKDSLISDDGLSENEATLIYFSESYVPNCFRFKT